MRSTKFVFHYELAPLSYFFVYSCLMHFSSHFTSPVLFYLVTSLSPFFLFLPFYFVCLIPSLYSHNLRLVIVPHTLALRKKENGKTANPTASYGTRVYQPIMPFSNFFSSQYRSLCVCTPTAPPPSTFPLLPNKGSKCCIFSGKTSCNVTPTPTTADCYSGIYTEPSNCLLLQTWRLRGETAKSYAHIS